MKSTIVVKSVLLVLSMVVIPHLGLAANGKPFDSKTNYRLVQLTIADTTLPVTAKNTPDKPDQKPAVKEEEKNDPHLPVQVVKVIPKARRQPIPVPVKVNVRPVKIMKPKIIKPVVKPVIKILH